MLVWGGLVGLFTGLVTVLYRWAVIEGNTAIWGGGDSVGTPGQIALRVLIPPIGGLVVGFLLYRLGSYKPGHGIPSVIHAVQTNQIHASWRMAVPSAASVVVLTTGGSAGPEGPVAEIGSVFGSNIGHWIKAKPRSVRTLVGSGVAAAIAAIFGAPIGGVFFAIEVIFQGFEVALFAPVVLAAVVASLVTRAKFGDQTAVVFPEFTFHPMEFPAYVGLGLLAGLLAAGFIFWIQAMTRVFEKISIPLWWKPALGGLGIGIIGLFLPQVIGEGYESLNRQFRGEVSAILLACLLAGKFLATGLTLGSGAPGGCFAPAIFLGGALGGLFGKLVESLAPDVVTNPAAYALMGMAGLVAATFNAPMTAIMIAIRVTHNSFDALIPLMTTVALSTFVMSRWDHTSVYIEILRRHGQWFPRDFDKDPLLGLTAVEVLRTHPKRLLDTMKVEEALGYIRDSDETAFVVEDAHARFLGVVSLQDLRLTLTDPVLGRLVNLGDVVDLSTPGLSPETSLREAVREFSASKAEALPVFDSKRLFLGLVTRDDVLAAYRVSNQ
jgi:CIC family chloride channel protein